jgi:hypothetical protein
VFIMKDFEQSLTHNEPRLSRPSSACPAPALAPKCIALTAPRKRTPKPETAYSDRPPDGFGSDFFRRLAASSCSTRSLR